MDQTEGMWRSISDIGEQIILAGGNNCAMSTVRSPGHCDAYECLRQKSPPCCISKQICNRGTTLRVTTLAPARMVLLHARTIKALETIEQRTPKLN